jgi:hypothetical protein
MRDPDQRMSDPILKLLNPWRSRRLAFPIQGKADAATFAGGLE